MPMQINPADNPACAAQHFGLWMVEPLWFAQAMAMVKAGKFPAVDAADRARQATFRMDANGVAVIQITGPMTKGDSSFGGTSTVAVRRSVRAAMTDASVRAVMLTVDSPGGTVAGTAELADDIKALAAIKPVHAHISDLGASAAYWAASAASFVSANRIAEVGSIGAVAALLDSSSAMEMAGLEVLVFATGPFKAAGVEGTEVTDQQRAHFQDRVESQFAHFSQAVAANRRLTPARLATVSSGKMFGAGEAVELGLIDAVMPFDDAMAALAKKAGTPNMDRTARRLRMSG